MKVAEARGIAKLALAVSLACALAAGARADAPATPRHVYSVRNSPGYTPLVDPESSSVVLGRRLNAPLVGMPFTGGARSQDDLGRAICRAIEVHNKDSLLALCVTDDEFRDILWREFPQSRPAVGATWLDAWRMLYARLHAGCSHAIRDYGERRYEFVRFEQPDSTLGYRNFTMHSRLKMVVRDEQGRFETWKWLRAAVGRKGRWKIYSTDD